MKRTLSLSALILMLAATATPVAPGDPHLPDWGGGTGPDDEGFFPCPWPPCMAPCQFPPEPQGLCKSPDGTVGETSFFCCCCGGSNASFKFHSPWLDLGQAGGVTVLSWTEIPGAEAFDVVRGDLNSLRSGAGNFGAATVGCVEDDTPQTTELFSATPEPGKAFWFVIRGGGAGGGTYDATSAVQAGGRDAGIAASNNDCSAVP